jgi:hypothetical protein
MYILAMTCFLLWVQKSRSEGTLGGLTDEADDLFSDINPITLGTARPGSGDVESSLTLWPQLCLLGNAARAAVSRRCVVPSDHLLVSQHIFRATTSLTPCVHASRGRADHEPDTALRPLAQ